MAGKSVADGGKSGTVRNPEFFCARPGCTKYRVKGTTVCRSHGAALPTVERAAARRTATAEVAALVEKERLRPQDMPRVVMEQLQWQVNFLRDLQQELDGLSLIGGPVEMAREYADILDRVDKSSAALAKLMTSIAALDIADSFRRQTTVTEAERTQRANRLIAVTLEAEATVDMWRCPVCSRACCSQPVEAELVDDVG